MRQDEHEAYDEAHREVEGLRRLADAVETPPSSSAISWPALSNCCPRGQTRRLWWMQRLMSWQLRPLVWGPVLALVCFVAGTFVSPPYPGPPGRRRSKKKPSIAPNTSSAWCRNLCGTTCCSQLAAATTAGTFLQGRGRVTGCTAACPQSVAAARNRAPP